MIFIRINVCTGKFLIDFPLFLLLDKQANGRMPLLQEPLFGARPQPYSTFLFFFSSYFEVTFQTLQNHRYLEHQLPMPPPMRHLNFIKLLKIGNPHKHTQL